MQFKAKQYFNLKCKEFRNDFVDVDLNGLLSRLIQTMLDIMSNVHCMVSFAKDRNELRHTHCAMHDKFLSLSLFLNYNNFEFNGWKLKMSASNSSMGFE